MVGLGRSILPEPIWQQKRHSRIMEARVAIHFVAADWAQCARAIQVTQLHFIIAPLSLIRRGRVKCRAHVCQITLTKCILKCRFPRVLRIFPLERCAYKDVVLEGQISNWETNYSTGKYMAYVYIIYTGMGSIATELL